jgi:hypothetical protein
MTSANNKVRGPRAETFITDLIGHANTIGFHKNNSYIVFIHGPGEKMFSPYGKPENILPLTKSWKQRLALTCINASLPGKSLSTVDFSTYGPPCKLPYVENYTNEITLTFNCSTDMFEKHYFTAWQNLAVSRNSHSVKFYNNYAKKFSITIMIIPNYLRSFEQLSIDRAFYSTNAQTPIQSSPYDPLSPYSDYFRNIYFVQLEECYPLEIVETPLSYKSTGDILSFDVRMAFANWFDPVSYWEDQQIDRIQRSFGTDVDSVARVGRVVQETYPTDTLETDSAYADWVGRMVEEKDPTVRLGIASAYADRGRVLEQRDLELKEDRVGMSQTPMSPFQKLVAFARAAARYSNPKELKQLIVDKGLDYLGEEFGITNVESIARGGQVIDVIFKSKDNTISKARGGIGSILGAQDRPFF